MIGYRIVCLTTLACCAFSFDAIAVDSGRKNPPDLTRAVDGEPYERVGWAPPTILRHEQPVSDEYLPRPAVVATGVMEHCGPWERDGFVSIQVNVDHRGCNILGDAANEPSIAIDPTDPRKIVIGWRQYDSVETSFQQAGWAYSRDAGRTWVFTGVLTPGVLASDPVLTADAEGVIYFLSPTLAELRLFRSNDGGITWDSPIQVVPFFADKPWMTSDHTEGIGRGNIYAYWASSEENFLRTTDGGSSLELQHVEASTLGTMSVGPDGTLYISGSRIDVTKSSNAHDPGQVPVFEPRVFADLGGDLVLGGAPPNPGGLLGQIWVATDNSAGSGRGNVYLLASVWRSNDDLTDTMFARSEDGGSTWTAPIRVNDDPEGSGTIQWFGTMSVAPNGRIDAVWNDTRANLSAETANLSELYYAFSTDAGDTWSKNIPVSPVFDSRVGWPSAGGSQKLGDYYDMISDNLGVNVAYAATFNGEQDIYFLRIGPWDCNSNEVPDETDIATGESLDCNANDVPDECEYRGDADGDGLTTLRDLAAYQSCFTGSSGQITDPICRLFDLNEDSAVDISDLPALQRVLNGP